VGILGVFFNFSIQNFYFFKSKSINLFEFVGVDIAS